MSEVSTKVSWGTGEGAFKLQLAKSDGSYQAILLMLSPSPSPRLTAEARGTPQHKKKETAISVI